MLSAIRGSIKCLTKRWPARLSLLLITSAGAVAADANDPFTSTTFGDWQVSCTPVEVNKGLECTMSQRIEFEDNSEPLLKIDLYLNPRSSKPEAVFVLPLGIPLANRPVLSFNHSKGFALNVSHCHSDGCYFKTPLSNALLETFLSMRSGQIRLSGNDNETIKIPISGKGSRAAHNYFEALPKD